jgi:hypothetical protein
MGIAVFFGMLGVSLCGLLWTPAFYALLTALPFAASFRNKGYVAISDRMPKTRRDIQAHGRRQRGLEHRKTLMRRDAFFPPIGSG